MRTEIEKIYQNRTKEERTLRELGTEEYANEIMREIEGYDIINRGNCASVSGNETEVTGKVRKRGVRVTNGTIRGKRC